jgi:hypothetical protein
MPSHRLGQRRQCRGALALLVLHCAKIGVKLAQGKIVLRDLGVRANQTLAQIDAATLGGNRVFVAASAGAVVGGNSERPSSPANSGKAFLLMGVSIAAI